MHKTATYERLAQDPSDNEEEDDVLFNQDGVTVKQNGFTRPRAERLHKQQETIEMNNLHSPSKNNKSTTSKTAVPSGDVKVKLLRSGLLSRTRVTCFVLSLILGLGLTFMFTLVMPYWSAHKGQRTRIHMKTPSWNKVIKGYGKCALQWSCLNST